MKPSLILPALLWILANLEPVDGQASLARNGDVGKVVDCQGITSVRAKLGKRWSPAGTAFALKPGDWLRTDVRGANALAFRLEGGTQIILGPGTLVEVIDAKTIGFTRGEIEVASAGGSEIVVRPGEGRGVVVRDGDRKVLRRPDGRGIEALPEDPDWLQGFKGVIPSESMGSLLAKVDGRNTPLTLGYHKVTVDIRDGIARTVIEESFVNHTRSRLEGTFYFPLPQDASISGFGMWIGGELVEADVVEKQRAREIYETILRERRDPGLLEWTGGNLFKARVFPIEGRSEKRIKITYTQVLPVRHGKLRYSYGLQSEMLRQNPLRELSINVRVHSALPIRSFACTSHDARISSTRHSGQAEFVAQEYTPDRDFEVEVDLVADGSPVVMIPHRRGEDGYFLALVTPPGAGGGWRRDFVPDGEPVDLVVLADTSGSMNPTARANQDALIAGLLGSLGEDDRFSIATCDNEVRWFEVEKFAGTREAYLDLARSFVAARRSLGWTDLDRVFDAAMELAGDRNTHVIYIGDGVVTTGNADPVAFAERLRRRYREAGGRATFHAIAPSASYEPGVLKAIASLGGGSVRRVAGSDSPGSVARSLLAGIARPGMRDLKVEFEGIRAARVYPEELPNLPAGAQQVVIGRYLPEGKSQQGKVIVTGVQDGKQVRFTAPVSLEDAEAGNSFIPRLWARRYLDVLLEQGRSQEIKDEIIALSEEYKIMTPYTSFLVLESDADRERFKVKKRFQMRDGERFFADGREQANYELLQQQMRLAGTWRLDLRRGYLRELRQLGRDPDWYRTAPRSGGRYDYQYPGGELGGPIDLLASSTLTAAFDQPVSASAPAVRDLEKLVTREEMWSSNGDKLSVDESWEMAETEWADGDMAADAFGPAIEDDAFLPMRPRSPGEPMAEFKSREMGARKGLSSFRQKKKELSYMIGGRGSVRGLGERYASGLYAGDLPWHWRGSMGDLESLFPPVPAAGRKPLARGGDQPDHPWGEAAVALADSLVRLDKIAALEGRGIAITQQAESFNLATGDLSSLSRVDALISGKAWWVRSGGDSQGGDVQWWQDGGERGHYYEALGLGRRRPADLEEDRFAFPLDLGDLSLGSIADSLRHLDVVQLKTRKGAQASLVLGSKTEPGVRHEYLIDTGRQVVLEIKNRRDGEVASSISFSDFVELGGCWWARKVEHRDRDGKLSRRISRTLMLRGEDEFAAELEGALAPGSEVVFIRGSLPAVEQAKAGEPSFETAFALFNGFAESQRWDRAGVQFDAMSEFAGEKRGLEFLQLRFLGMKRRNEEARVLAFSLAEELAAEPGETALYLARHLTSELQRSSNTNERYEIFELLKPIYLAAPGRLRAMKDWRHQMVYILQGINRRPEALEMLRGLADEFPADVNLQTQYASQLSNSGQVAAALAWLDGVLEGQDNLQAWELSNLRSTYLNLLEGQGRVRDVLRVVSLWLEDEGIDGTQSAWIRRRYLSALIRTGENDKAYRLIGEWIGEAVGFDGEEMEAAMHNRVQVAIETLFGSAYNVYRNDLDQRFHQPLAKLVQRYALDEHHFSLATRTMQDHRFSRTEAARKLRARFTARLAKRVGKLSVAEVGRLYGWISNNDPAVEKATWEGIVATLISRWERQDDVSGRDAIAALVTRISSAQLGGESHLTFLRRQLAEGAEEHRGRYAQQLFEAILTQPYLADLEEEAFSLLYALGVQPAPAQGATVDRDAILSIQADALLRLDDWILDRGFQAAWAQVEDKEALSRVELADRKRELIQSVRSSLSARLQREAEAPRGEELADWLTVERLYLDVALRRDPDLLAAECWEYLGDLDLMDPPERGGRPLHEIVLIARHVATLEYLATRAGADPALVDRLLRWLDRGIEAQPDSPAWKGHKYRLLVMLDRPEDLKRSLASWIAPDDSNHRWRITLGYLHAELNEISRAVAVFEEVEEADVLGPREYKALADWYLIQDKQDQRDRAILAYYDSMPEYQLSNLIQRHSNQIQVGFNNGTPEELDPAVVDMFRAIFRKSPYPQNYLGQLGSLYRYTKDFRMLECLAEGVLGNSAQQVYPFLGSLESILQYVGDEATTDEILAHVASVRGRAVTPVDQRGLDLLEMQVRRRASEVLNQPGQQVPLALAAMRRAFKPEWGSGERRLMADLLARLGEISQGPLAAEQMRQFEQLFLAEEKATPDRLHIAVRWSHTLRGYPRRERGKPIIILESALDEYLGAHGGSLTGDSQTAFDQLIGFFESDRTFARGEDKIFEAMGSELSLGVSDWLTVRKFQLYRHAVSAGEARVSLGQGEVLYKNVERALIAELATGRNHHRYQLCSELHNLYRAAHFNARIASAKEDIVNFGAGAFDEMIGFETQHYQSLVQTLASHTRELAGDLPALAFLIGRYEKEPEWFRVSGKGGWQRCGYYMARYRDAAKEIGDLEPRLLQIVLTELRRDLESQVQQQRSMYHDNNSHFWSARRGDFLDLATQVAREHKKSIVALKYLADYLFHGLEAKREAIAILVDAHRRGIQDENGISQLAGFYESTGQHAEAVPYLREIVGMDASVVDYRRRLVTALALAGRGAEAIGELDQAIAHFKELGRWHEPELSELARACFDGELWEQGAGLYDELIPLHQRTQRNRGVGNGTLSDYYTKLSRCRSNLGETSAAVEAAAGAIVSWGSSHRNREFALQALLEVLRASADLDAYVAELDRAVEESGLENPIVRKALGQVFLDAGEAGKAIRHLGLAVASGPDDAETNRLLVRAYDTAGDREGALARLLDSVEKAPREIALLNDLGKRYAQLGRAAEAERAWTGIVEALPNESEGHAMLAEIRQGQDRWADAAAHWKEVAEIRALEPTGLQRLAEAQMKLGDMEEAIASLQSILAKEWPARFGDVHRVAREKLVALEKSTATPAGG